jgi:hypothetical protein
MNIIKIQDMLRGVPDNALIGYVQDPKGDVPSYLALSELQRRKDTRAKYQQQQAPESSVAEDLEQETAQDQGGLAMLAGQPQQDMADQGVAGLDTGDMYQEENFAAGGIVAFAPGGTVYPNYEGPATSAVGRAWDSITGGLKGYGDRKSKLMDLQQQIETLQPNLFESLTPSELSTRKAKIEELKAQQDAIRNPSSGYVYKEGEKAVDPTMKSYIEQTTAAEEAKKNPYKPLSDKEKEAIKKQFNYADDKSSASIGTSKGATPTQQPAESEDDYLRKRMALYKEFMGPNEDRTKLQEKIDAMEKRAQRQEDLAPWMALTEAGFKTMQGTSPYALTNIGAGAEAGIKSYGAAQDKMAALEEKRYTLMNEAAKADRAEKQAIVKFGFDSEEAKANRDQKERLGQAELALKAEANRLTKDYNTARLNAVTDKGLLKSQAEQMIKVNKDIDAQLAYLAAAPKSEKITTMINNLKAQKAQNEAHIKSLYANLKNPGLAGTETSATNTSDWGDLQVN